MKKLLIPLLILATYGLALGELTSWNGITIGSEGGGGGGGLYDESFDPTGYDAPFSGWTETGSPDEDATTFTHDSSDESFSVSQVLTGTEEYSELDLGDDTDDVDITFFMYVDALVLPATNDNLNFFDVYSQADQWGGSLRLYENSGFNIKGAAATTSLAISPLDEDEWIQVTLEYRRNATSTVTVISSSHTDPGSSATFTANDEPCGKLRLGITFGLESNETLTAYWDSITINKIFDKTNIIAWYDLANDFENKNDVGTLDAAAVNSAGFTTGPFSDANGALDAVVTGDEHASVTDDDALTPSGDWSVVFWMDPDAGTGRVAGQRGVSSDRAWSLEYRGAGFDDMELAFSDDGTGQEAERSGVGDFPDGSGWFHVAVVFDESANSVEMFHNGVSVHTGTFTAETGAMNNSTEPLRIGAGWSATDAADVDIARFSLWGRKLTSDEVLDLYNSGSDIKYEDL